ncbi:fucolectin-1-like [Gigantopelta aegis]|uniref:fucolectin-1-like n=1 Tax=Gigantopelta aegis TaxID=1735272 RepID=UPI001B88ADFB|nr:fucolectin-1-like [Gigantopelta aegis]
MFCLTIHSLSWRRPGDVARWEKRLCVTMLKYVSVWITLCILRLNGTLFSNLAFQKPATMSTVYNYISTPARAVDGNNGTDWYSDFCASSNYDDLEPWWMVDLRGYFHIHNVTITNRGDGNWRRLHSFTIDVFTENPIGCARATPVQCYNRTDQLGRGETVQFKCRSPVIGRFVRIKKWKMMSHDDVLTLCEVQVIGTKETACPFTRLFHRARGTRLDSTDDVISGVADVMNCASRCGHRDCLAFNYNQNSQQCQLISAPTFLDSTTMTSSWDYYGVDLC